MSNKLSHSSVTRYNMCPRSYKLHYVDKIRPVKTTSALLFGSAIDEALNSMLSKDGRDPYQIFTDKWTKATINKESVNLIDSMLITYNKSDYDETVLLKDDFLNISKYKELNPNEPDKLLNVRNWHSMHRKGLLMLKAYESSILPRIIRVIAIQKSISYDNGSNGDTITGMIDLVAEMDDGKTYILDNKTAKTLYKPDSVKLSEQLSLYGNHEGIEYGGYLVIGKTLKHDRKCSTCGYVTDNNRIFTCDRPHPEIKGRCNGQFEEKVLPRVVTQVILDKLDKKLVNSVMKDFSKVNAKINNEEFPMNESQCDNWFGSKCPYFDYCHGKKKDGLIKLSKIHLKLAIL